MPIKTLPLPDQNLLLDLFAYDPESGLLTRRVTQGGRVCGELAGGLTAKGYLALRVGGKTYKAHRIIWKMMTGDEPPEIDHRDMVPSNNCWSNLRAADHARNMANRGPLRNNTSGFKGVCFHKRQRAWCASIKVNGRQIYLGAFATKEDAAAAYDAAERLHRGEYARAA